MADEKSFYLDAHRQCPPELDKGITFTVKSKTEQSHRETCDVNNIVKQYAAAGFRSQDFQELSQQMMSLAHEYQDASVAGDLLEAHQMYKGAEDNFVQFVPADIRTQFNNNPMEFYKFAADKNNADKLRSMFADYHNYAAPRADQLTEAVEQIENKNK